MLISTIFSKNGLGLFDCAFFHSPTTNEWGVFLCPKLGISRNIQILFQNMKAFLDVQYV